MRTLLLTAALLGASSARADMTTYDAFKDEPAKGGLACHTLLERDAQGNLGDRTRPMELFYAPGKPKGSGRPARDCLRGGGECDCWLLYTESAPVDGEKALYRLLRSGDWALAPRSVAKDLESIAVEVPEAGSLAFRDEKSPEVYADAGLKSRIPPAALAKAPPAVLAKIPKEKNSRRLVHVFQRFIDVDGRKVGVFRAELHARDEDAMLDETKIFLRELYVPMFGKDGRLAAWIAEPIGC